MGVLSKIAKGFRTGLKSIGKKIKSTVKGFGKFMGKIGIVGQIGLSLLMPGIGTMFSNLAAGMSAYTGIGSTIVNAAGKVMQTAINIAGKAGNVFKNITEGVTGVLKEVGGATANQLGLGDTLTKLGFDTTGKSFANAATKVGELFDGSVFTKTPDSVLRTAAQKSIEAGTSTISEGISVPKAPTVESLAKQATQMPTASDFTSELSVEGLAQTAAKVPSSPLSVAGKESASTFSSLLARGKQAVMDLPRRAGEAIVGKIEDVPQMIGEATEDAIKTKGKQLAYEAAGVETPEYTSVQYGTYVPTIQEAPMVQPAPSLDFVKYYNDNYTSMSAAPYGSNALIYNAYKLEANKRGI
jgi:hypothetical protein